MHGELSCFLFSCGMLSDTSHTLDVNRNINRKVSLYEKSHMRSEESEKAFFDNLLLVDHDLSLTFAGKEGVSPPDTDVVAYHFTMNHACTGEKMGRINIKAGYTENIIRYRGNIGYTVYEKYRGNHYSSRSCRLLVPVLRYLGMNPVYITCDADNVASRKNIEALGAEFLGIERITESSPYCPYYPEKARVKLRYRWEVGNKEQDDKREVQDGFSENDIV